MKDFNIGKIIKEQRIKMGISQEALCDGICEPQTLSKIERGVQRPRHDLLVSLLERLGLDSARYWGICSLDDYKMDEYRLQIKTANGVGSYKEAILLRNEMEKKFGCKDRFSKQFFLWTDAINGKIVDNSVTPYTDEEQLSMLLEAILITVPNFNKEPLANLSFGLTEAKIINSIANTYCKIGNLERGFDIYTQLLNYINNHFFDLSEGDKIIPLLSYNYSMSLSREGINVKALEIAEKGIESCRHHRKEGLLGGLLINKACSLNKLGYHDEGKKVAVQSYYVFEAMSLTKEALTVKKYLKETYDFIPF